MIIRKFTYLATAAAAAFGGGAAQAQFLFPAAIINGAGASLPQDIVRQSGDCYGLKQVLGFGMVLGPPGGPQPEISLFDFNNGGTTLPSSFNCAGNAVAPPVVVPGQPRIVQPLIAKRYLSTGSGQGIVAWLNNRVSATILHSPGFVPYTSNDGYQFSLSGTPLSPANLTTYNATAINPFNRYTAADTAANLFGAPIQLPYAVGAIAVAYDPVYAKERGVSGLVNEYRFQITGARSDGSGGLRLTRAQVCGIFNGVITNWNQLPASVVNKDVNDTAPFNVPIRLVGMSELSGTTSVFTRAMARQCTGLSVNTGFGGMPPLMPIPNRFGDAENRLPYSGAVTIPNTAYTGAPGAVSPTNSLASAFFDKQTNNFSFGAELNGRFTVANGDDGVAMATNFHPVPGPVPGTRTLNGRIAYLSPEQALPATLWNGANTYGLNTASLQQNGTGTLYFAPDARSTNTAFTSLALKPPQTKGAAGAYCSDPAACPTAFGDRGNPLDWVRPASKTESISAPAKGYPLIGTTNLLLYTCYATSARRQAINGYVATVMGKTTKDFNNQVMYAPLFSDLVRSVFFRNGIAPMPPAWRTAITETFLKRSTQLGQLGNPASRLGDRLLWVQDRIPTAPVGPLALTASNPLCLGKPGA